MGLEHLFPEGFTPQYVTGLPFMLMIGKEPEYIKSKRTKRVYLLDVEAVAVYDFWTGAKRLPSPVDVKIAECWFKVYRPKLWKVLISNN